MRSIHIRRFLAALSMAAALPVLASARGVEPLFDLASPSGGPFPSNRFTRPEPRNLTRLQVSLPKPDCAVEASRCEDVDILNELDGFNVHPRLRIPFNGPIDPASVDGSNVFLVRLAAPRCVVRVNQVVWDPESNTLFAEPDELLDQHGTYALIVTDGVRDARGDSVGREGFRRVMDPRTALDAASRRYRAALAAALEVARVPVRRVAAASVFTTQSTTAFLEKARDQIKGSIPSAADFRIVLDGSRAVFRLAEISGAVARRQVAAVSGAPTSDEFFPLTVLDAVHGPVGTVAFGRYTSPDFETGGGFIPETDTRTGEPAALATRDVYFNLFLPSTPKPAAGWPVAIFGHGLGDSKEGGALAMASSLAARGIATVAINAVGHGGGPAGTLVVLRSTGQGPAVLPLGGRGVDQNRDGWIEPVEGIAAAAPRATIGLRDGLRQTVVDLVRLVRVIQTGGVDADGDGSTDLDPRRVYFAGHSFGGIYGTMLLAVEPGVKAGALSAAGGSYVDIARLGTLRPVLFGALAARTPALLNVFPVAPPAFGFNDNTPPRGRPPVVNDVPGAVAIQDFLDVAEWVSQSGNAVAYAPHLRKSPLAGIRPRPVLVQMALGDQTVPNPAGTALIRAGGLADRTTLLRYDLVFAADPSVPQNPHNVLLSVLTPGLQPLAFAAQAQIAAFFESRGAVTVDPDGASPLFETPVALPLPER